MKVIYFKFIEKRNKKSNRHSISTNRYTAIAPTENDDAESSVLTQLPQIPENFNTKPKPEIHLHLPKPITLNVMKIFLSASSELTDLVGTDWCHSKQP